MLGALIGAGASAIGNVVSNLVGSSNVNSTNQTNLRIARDNRSWQTQERNEQNTWNQKQWERNNAYNTPEAQMQRLRDAGLNPYLAMSGSGGSVSGNSTPLSSASAPGSPTMPTQQAFIPQNDLTPAFMNLGEAIDHLSIRRATAKKINADAQGQQIQNTYTPDILTQGLQTGKLAQQGLQLDNKTKTLQNQFTQDTYENNIQQNRLTTDMMTAQVAAQQLDNQTKTILNQFMPAQQQADLLIKYTQQSQMVLNMDLTKAQIQESLSRMKVNLAQEILSYSQAKVNTKQLDVMDANIANINANTANTQTHTSINKVEYNKALKTASSIIESINMANILQSTKDSNSLYIEGDMYNDGRALGGASFTRYWGDRLKDLNPINGLFK